MSEKESNKIVLINKTVELLTAGNYHSVSVNDLCAAANIRPGSFYYFFPSKRDLFCAALDECWKQYENEVFIPSFEKNASPRARIMKFYNILYRKHYKYKLDYGFVSGCPFGNLIAEIGSTDKVLRVKTSEIFGKITVYFDDFLRDLIDIEKLSIADVLSKARALLAFYEGIMLLAKAKNNPETIRDMTPSVLPLIGIGMIHRI